MISVELDRLERVRRWAAVPTAERGEEWVHEFEGAFWCAPLSRPSAEAPIEHDGNRFLRITAHEWAQGRDFVRPSTLVDYLIDQGVGIVLTDQRDVSMVWMTLGEVVSYRLYGRAFSNPLIPVDLSVDRGQSLQLWPPKESTFPHWARTNVRRYLQSALGIAEPKAVYARFPSGSEAIVFDLEPGRIQNDAVLDRAIRDLRWRLPKRLLTLRLDQMSDDSMMEAF